MPELQYKFKSSLSFETIKFSDSTITVGALKSLINQKQSIKTNGFVLKLKDSEGKVYNDDDEIIDIKHKIIVSRFPNITKPTLNVRKKESTAIIKATDVVQKAIDIITLEKKTPSTNESEAPTNTEISQVLGAEETTTIPITPDYFNCSLCKTIMKNATRINCCKKNFCYECITGYLFDPDISGSMECPDCKSTVSNCEANLTENIKIRDQIKSHNIGDIEATANDLLIDTDDKDGALTRTDIGDKQTIPVCVSPKINKENGNKSQMPDPDNHNVYSNDIHLPRDSLMNEITFEHEIPRTTGLNATGSSSDLPELLDSHIKDVSATIVPVNVLVDSAARVNESSNDDIAHDHNYKRPTDKESQSSHKRSHRTDQQPTEVKSCVVAKTSVTQSIEDLEFDPVLYMKFLKIVGEKYPDDLKKILSNNIVDTSHSSRESKTSSGQRHRSREEEDEKGRDKLSKKRTRRDNEVDVGQLQRGHVEKQIEKYHHQGHEEDQEMEVRRKAGYREKEAPRKSNGAPASKRYKSRSRSREVVMRPLSREVVMRPRSRELQDQRPKEYYGQPPPARYPRQQDLMPQYSDSRRRFKTDFSQAGRDKQKYGRRSDR